MRQSRGLKRYLELPAESHYLELASSILDSLELLSLTARTDFVNDAIESGEQLIIVRRGAGPLHIGREFRERMITRCGNDYRSDDVTVFRSKAAVTAVWTNWPRKCDKCRSGLGI